MPSIKQIDSKLLACALQIESCDLGHIESISYDIDESSFDPYGGCILVDATTPSGVSVTYVFTRHGLANIIANSAPLLEQSDALALFLKHPQTLKATKAIFRCFAITFGERYVLSELEHQRAAARTQSINYNQALKAFQQTYTPEVIELYNKYNGQTISSFTPAEIEYYKDKIHEYFDAKVELSRAREPYKYHKCLHTWIKEQLLPQESQR